MAFAKSIAEKPRQPKPVNYPLRGALRLDQESGEIVDRMRRDLSKDRGKKVGFSEAVRVLITDRYAAAMALAGRPEEWPTSTRVELPDELWEALTDCRNALSHARGSLYNISRKVNFDEGPVTRAEAHAAFEAIDESKAMVARLEERMVAFVTDSEAGARS